MSFIKIDRKIIDSEVFAHDGKLRFWLWLLVRARYESGFIAVTIGKGQHTIKLERGQLIFGRNSAENSLGVDGSTLYKWIKEFEADGMIKMESNSHYTLLTINKYSDYQDFDSEKVTTVEQPSNSNVTAIEQPCNTNKKDNTDKKDKKDKNNISMPPTIFEIQNYITEKGYSVDAERFYLYYEKIGWLVGKSKSPMKNWKAAVAEWNKRDKEKLAPKKPLPLPTAEQMKTETDKSILGRMFHIRDEFGLERNVLGYAVKSATVRYEILGEVFNAD